MSRSQKSHKVKVIDKVNILRVLSSFCPQTLDSDTIATKDKVSQHDSHFKVAKQRDYY